MIEVVWNLNFTKNEFKSVNFTPSHRQSDRIIAALPIPAGETWGIVSQEAQQRVKLSTALKIEEWK